jgi:putative tryptophan/tyrosine transport system substrate-binding protein
MELDQLKRRGFFALLGGAATWPLAASAQQAAMPVIGFLFGGSPETSANFVVAFRKGLGEAGYVEGQNVAIEYLWTHNENDRLPELAADLVRRRVTVIVTPNFIAAALAAKAATATIPIVFGGGFDPVQAGLVASLNQPGGNLTGVSFMSVETGGKRLGLLHELLPGAARFAMLVNPTNPNAEPNITEARAATSVIGRQIEVLTASTNRDIDTAFASLRADALLVSPEPLFTTRRVQLVTLAARHAVPTMYYIREFAEIGGLMSYGPNLADQYRQVGVYTGRILKGEKPADLPILRPTTFEFVINLQTAKTLGLEVPPTLLARADEVIE